MQANYLKKNEEVVISGMAGRFPKSANITEFADNLYNKVNLKIKFRF